MKKQLQDSVSNYSETHNQRETFCLKLDTIL